jgi:superfamily II DNA/RNA helicase
MGLPDRLTQELAKMGAATPFPIQEATIPAAMAGRHVLGRGKTGSGKTIAFGVPLVAMLAAAGNQPRTPNRPRAVVLAPTRELAIQIDRTLAQLAKSVGFFTTTVYGGVPQRQQQIALNRGVDIVIATPGRLEDLIAQGIVDLRGVERIVVDEADHMCDLGFIEPVNRILAQTGESQKLLFSATLDAEVSALVRKFMPNPYIYEVPGEVEETSDIEHRVLVLDPAHRSAIFHRLVQGAGKCIVFVRTKQTAEALSQSLNESGVPTARLHGDLNQAQRTRNLERFTKSGARVMIATDVAARGIHVDDVRLVIQLDLPEEYKTYLHRAGRTGRAGRSGTVVSLVATGRTRKVEGLLQRADREAVYTRVSPGDPILEELAGPIAPPPVVDGLDFGDSRFDSINKGAVKQELRDRHRPNKMGAAKDRRFRSR